MYFFDRQYYTAATTQPFLESVSNRIGYNNVRYIVDTKRLDLSNKLFSDSLYLRVL